MVDGVKNFSVLTPQPNPSNIKPLELECKMYCPSAISGLLLSVLMSNWLTLLYYMGYSSCSNRLRIGNLILKVTNSNSPSGRSAAG